MSGPLLAEIYLGKIKKWNDVKIKKANPKAKLPGTPVTPVFRSDGSGDTYAFTGFLSKVSPAWKSQVGFSTSVGFKAGVGAKGNAGITSTVSKTPGAIGYISASYLIGAGLDAVAVQNRAGNYEYPNLKNIEAAGATVKSVPASNAISIVNPRSSAKTAYPISTFTYAIVPHDAAQKGDLRDFVTYAITKGQPLAPRSTSRRCRRSSCRRRRKRSPRCRRAFAPLGQNGPGVRSSGVSRRGAAAQVRVEQARHFARPLTGRGDRGADQAVGAEAVERRGEAELADLAD